MTRINALKISAAAAVLALAAAACGGPSKAPSVASAGSTTTNSSSSSSSSSSGAGTRSGSGPGGGSLTMAGGANMQKFASCMRKNGVPSFPDPSSNGSVTFGSGTGIDPQSPAFQKAQKACRKYTPNGGNPPSPAQQAKMQAQALKFSACMRSHGVPKFPDPQFSGGGRATLQIGKSRGIDPNSSVFKAAQKACAANLPGAITSQRAAP